MAAPSGFGILNFERLIFILLNGLYIALRPAIRRRITFRVISLQTSLFIPIHYFFTKNLPVSSARHYYLGKYRRRTFHEYLWERYACLISRSPPRTKLVCLKRDHNIDDSVNWRVRRRSPRTDGYLNLTGLINVYTRESVNLIADDKKAGPAALPLSVEGIMTRIDDATHARSGPVSNGTSRNRR